MKIELKSHRKKPNKNEIWKKISSQTRKLQLKKLILNLKD